jgi:hypothetical protein
LKENIEKEGKRKGEERSEVIENRKRLNERNKGRNTEGGEQERIYIRG